MKNFFQKIQNFLRGIDFWLVVLPLFLSIVGLVSIYSSSQGNLVFFKKQLFFLILGVFLMILFSFFDLRHLKELPTLIYFLYFVSLLLLFLVVFFGAQIRGTKTWFRFSFFSFDPAEFAKISLLLLLAYFFSKHHWQLKNFSTILISGFFVFLPSFLIFLQPNAATAFLLILLWLFLLFISRIRLFHFFVLFLIFCFLAGILWAKGLKEYQKQRILAFLFSQKANPLKEGWSKTQAQIAIGSGGLLGKGIKKGSQVQLGFLPEPKTDFVFAAICEEMGAIAGVFLILILFALILRIFILGFKSSLNFSKFFCFGTGILIFFESFLNLGTNLGFLPVMGLSLPFVSYGGSNLISKFLLLGLLQSFCKA